ncbi:MAG: hypothetical protein IJT94_09065 [Oscillibacter sp.]|nr:hypothetical protein [Oscillibacter sp.]
MASFALGAGGFVSALLLFAAGFAAGWQMRGKVNGEREQAEAVRMEPPDKNERRKIREEQEALRELQSYSAADAYGLRGSTSATAGGM